MFFKCGKCESTFEGCIKKSELWDIMHLILQWEDPMTGHSKCPVLFTRNKLRTGKSSGMVDSMLRTKMQIIPDMIICEYFNFL